MAHWLMKSEPESYSWSDLVRDGAQVGSRRDDVEFRLRGQREQREQ